MSIPFSDTTNFKGLVQLFEREILADRGFVSGNTERLKQYTADANIALDDFVEMAIKSSGTWQWDDTNQTDYPIITTNLVASQRDYTFTTDESGNMILDIYRVFVADESGTFHEVKAKDVQSEQDTAGFYDGKNTTGAPNKYDKTGNSIFLDPIPNYNYTNGLKVYINREALYFAYTDTTKKAGIPGILHKYLYLKPAYEYARRNNLTVLGNIAAEVQKMEGMPGMNGTIAEYFSKRPRDEQPRLVVMHQDNK